MAVASSGFADVRERVVAGNNQFGLNVLNEVLKTEKGQNVFISPLSASVALSMLDNGAKGTTQAALEKTMLLTGIKLEDLNDTNKKLMSDLSDTGGNFSLNL